MKPIVKWAGGKRQLLPEILKRVPDKISVYYEPFFGGGAVGFELACKRAIINDYNADLMSMYRVIRDNAGELIAKVDRMMQQNSSDYYYDIRNMDRASDWNKIDDITKSERLIYLNKTGFNGLYRVNSQGLYNVPYGKYKNPSVDYDNIVDVCSYFRSSNVEIMAGDYKDVIKNVLKRRNKNGIFVYLDPPYVPLTATSAFVSYTSDGFGLKEQTELRDCCRMMKDAGVNFLLSNSSAKAVYELYDGFAIEEVEAKRAINSNGNKRGAVKELLIS